MLLEISVSYAEVTRTSHFYTIETKIIKAIHSTYACFDVEREDSEIFHMFEHDNDFCIFRVCVSWPLKGPFVWRCSAIELAEVGVQVEHLDLPAIAALLYLHEFAEVWIEVQHFDCPHLL